MINFKDLGIKPKITTFIGDKIKIDRILNTEIIIHDYKIEDSKKKLGTKLLTLQIERNQTKNIIFTGSNVLMDMISQVPKEKLPIRTTIIKDNERYEFT